MKRAIRANSESGIEPLAASPHEEIPAQQGDDQAPGKPLSADVFISYSRKDIAFARLIRASLQSCDLDTWIDWDRIPVGERWWDEICRAIERSNVFMFIISGSSMGSPVCRDEINQALKNHKRIIPILVDDLTPDAVHKFVPELPELNWVIFEKDHLFQITENQQVQSGPPEDRLVALPKLPQFEQAMARLSQAIHTDWDWVKSHTQLQVDALRWSSKGRDTSYLLRGSELEDAEGWLARAGGRDPQPTLLQSQFITASRLEETRRQRENSRRQRRLLWVIGGALAITAALGGVALIQRNEADHQRNEAQIQRTEAQTQRDEAQAQRDEAKRQATAALSGELAAESRSYQDTQFDVGLLLAAESWNTLDSYTSRNGLLSALQSRPRLKSVLWTPHGLSHMAFSPDGKLLAGSYCAQMDTVSKTACKLYEVGIWNTADGDGSGAPLAGQQGPLAFTPDGKGLITRNAQGLFVVWNLGLRQTQGRVFSDSTAWTVSLVFNPAGTMLAAGGCVMVSYPGGLCSDSHVVVWDFSSGRLLYKTAEANAATETSLAFSPDGRILAWSGCADTGKDKFGTERCLRGSVITWDTVSDQTVKHAVQSDSAILSIAFSPDGKTLAARDDSGSIALLDAVSWKETGRLTGPSGAAPSLTFGHDGATLAVTGLGDPVTLWDVRDADPTTSQIDQLSIGSKFFAHDSVALDPRDDILADTGCYQYDHTGFLCEQGIVLMWDIGIQPPPGRAYAPTTTSVGFEALSPDGARLARSSCVRTAKVNDLNDQCVEGRVDVIDVASGKPSGQPLIGLPSDVFPAAFTKAGDRLVTISETQIDLWDVGSGTRVRPSLVSNAAPIGLALGPDGRTLILNDGSEVERWDLVTGQSAADPLPGWPKESFLEEMAFSPDGTRLAADSCAKHLSIQDLACLTIEIRIWNTATWRTSGEPIVLTADPTKTAGLNVADLQFSPDGSQLTIASSEGIRFWDVAKGQFSDNVIPTINPESIAYARSGKLLAVAERQQDSSPAHITLWDLVQMQPVGKTFIDGEGGTSLVFSTDDATVVSTSGLLWDVDPAAWKARVCQMARRNLTAAEWTKYVGSTAYHDTCSFPVTPTGQEPAPQRVARSTAGRSGGPGTPARPRGGPGS